MNAFLMSPRGRCGRRWLCSALLLAVLVSGLSACFSSPPPPPPPPPLPPTLVDLTLSAAKDSNPDGSGRASPVVVRVYELTAPHALTQADFMQIFTKDDTILGPQLRGKTEIVLLPGQQQSLHFDVKPDSRGLGVVAFFRDYRNANWRVYAEIPRNQTSHLIAGIGARNVTLATAPR